MPLQAEYNPEFGPPGEPLTPREVLERRKIFGPNIIPTSKPPKWYTFLFRALVHPFNILLAILAIASAATGEYDTMGIMITMVALSTSLRFHQEYRSQKAANSLRSLVSHKIHVIRKVDKQILSPLTQLPLKNEEIQETEILTENLVPGDWIKLNPGDVICADVIIFQSKDLYISQASLTGESVPVEKFPMTQANKHLFKHSLTPVTSLNGNGHTNILISQDTPTKPSKGWNWNFIKSLFGLQIGLESNIQNPNKTRTNLDLPNQCFMGTSVVTGVATAIVKSTGSSTYFGEMAQELAKSRPQNAFQLGVRRISWIFFITMAFLVPPVLLLQGFLNSSWNDAFLFALSVAVGLTPEMLPMIVNTTLAKGALQMSKQKCIVKNLDAIVNMGGINILCTDKTGTLTKSVVALTKHISHKGEKSKLPLVLAYLNSKFQSTIKNPLDDAVNDFYENVYLHKVTGDIISKDDELFGTDEAIDEKLVNQFKLIEEIPFDFNRRRVSVLIQKEDENSDYLMICKGAVEETLSVCSKIFWDSGHSGESSTAMLEDEIETSEMTSDLLEQLIGMSNDLNEEGLRVVVVAYKKIPRDQELQMNVDQERDLTFVGFIAFLDPPKESTAEAIQRLRQNNVEIKVLTGDSSLVCKKICAEINLPVRSIVTSEDLDRATSDEEVSTLAQNGTIFAKLSPLQKADIIKALKRNGHIVGFLGDGINDSPALTEADVGISVDSATDIAKESADIILLEKNIGVVADGVIIGRTTYGNTLKYIVMAVSSNFGNVFSVLVASSWLPFLPMLPIHILVQNLLYDLSQVSIPWDHMDKEFLAVPHRWSMKSVLRFMVWMGPWSSVFDITTFVFMYFYYGIKTDKDDVSLFQTTWFTVGLLTQTLIVHMIRTAKIPFVQSWASKPVVCLTVLVMGIGLAIPYVPGLSTWLQMVHLKPMVYPYILGALISYCCAAQIAKVIYKRIFHEWF